MFCFISCCTRFWGATKHVLVVTDNRSLTQFSSVKQFTPISMELLVLSFNILLAHIPGKAISAADFLSRMQTEPNLTLQIKLTDYVPVREIKKETGAKAPDVFLPKISGFAPIFEESNLLLMNI